jgi:hypothetical protein
MPDETQPAATGIIHRAHAIEFGVKVLIGIAAAIGSLGGLFVQIYGQLGFGPTIIVSAILTLIVTQLPLVLPWGRKHFRMWHSRYPWISTLVAVILVIFVLFHDYAERVITHRPSISGVPVPASVATPTEASGPKFVKNQRLQLEPFKSSGPNEWWDAISYHAEYVSSGKHLAAYLEYSDANMGVFVRPTRIQLRDSQNFLRNGDLTLSVIMREERSDGRFNFIWGADITKEKALFLGNYRARIVLVDDYGSEQRYYFLITGGTIMNTDVIGGKLIPYPNFITDENLDFPAQWEVYDAQH